MRRTNALVFRYALALMVLLLPAAGSLGGEENESAAAVADSAFDRAQLAGARGDWETAWHELKEARLQHPESSASRRVFANATYSFRRVWFQHRFDPGPSAWQGEERDFLFEWAASYFDATGAFPQEEMEALLIGFPLHVFGQFKTWAEGREAIGRWRIEAIEDNGIIESVHATSRES